jgi:eukaryotic-like serine/threonine-protein kinase
MSPETEPRLTPGSSLGPYEVLGWLGAGGMGEVYRARDPRLGREVAIKVLPRAFAVDADRLRRFEQEARAVAALSHPGIVAVFDVGHSANGTAYVVSELLQGQTLAHRIGEGPLPTRKALAWGVQIAHGLSAAHEKGIVHRDLKPANLFVLKDGRVKILDFGLAKLRGTLDPDGGGSAADTLTQTGSGVVVGTVGYMSPEQVRGLAADPRSDIFSLGAVLYEMLSRRRLFQRETAAETMTAVLKDDPPPLSETDPLLPASVDRVVRRCLEKDPGERFQSARDVAFALEALSGSSGTSAAMEAAPTAHRRRRWTVPTAVGLVLLTGLALGALGERVIGQRRPGTLRRLTYGRGFIHRARFAPDGQVVCSASWDGKPKDTFTVRPEAPEGRSLGLAPGSIQSISAAGEMLIVFEDGTLSRAPLAGGVAPRAIATDVAAADWTPDGKELAVVTYAEGKVRVEFPLGKPVYETPGWIDVVRVSPGGDKVAFIEHPQQEGSVGTGTLLVVDSSGRKQVLVRDWANFEDLSWAPGGDEIWFTASGPGAGMFEENSQLYAVTTAGSWRTVAWIPGNFDLHDVDKGGRALVDRADTRDEMIGLFPPEARERNLSWLNYSVVADLTADGRTALFTGIGPSLGASAYLRKTDGSAAVPLADGTAAALSPDERWALVIEGVPGRKLVLVPTGPGEPRTLDLGDIAVYRRAAFLPDGERVLFVGNEKDHAERGFVQSLAGGAARPVTPEGVYVAETAISPDGRWVAGVTADQVSLYPIDGGAPRRVPGLPEGGIPIRWSGDGRFLYVRVGDLPVRVYKLDPNTARRELWKELMPADPAGVRFIESIRLTPDGASYAYSYSQFLSTLYLAEGLK